MTLPYEKCALVAAMAGITGATASAPADASADLTPFLLRRTGTVTISAPTSFSLGESAPGERAVSRLRTVRVDDTRGPGGDAWTVVVSATDFLPDKGRPIPRADLRYWSGPATATTGDGRFIPGQATRATAQPLSRTRVAFRHAGGTTDNSASWRPTLIISIPPTAAADRYTGAIVHSVA